MCPKVIELLFIYYRCMLLCGAWLPLVTVNYFERQLVFKFVKACFVFCSWLADIATIDTVVRALEAGVAEVDDRMV